MFQHCFNFQLVVFQLVESTSLSHRRFQIVNLRPYNMVTFGGWNSPPWPSSDFSAEQWLGAFEEFNEKQIENHKDLGKGDRGAGSTRQVDPPH